ncbi:MAG: Methenyltetrahydrofolate cyclohydrolase [Candidatus Peregrinibacteria bacterium GW2011_GWA2_33_10]|nr:MAG: Methenyltetrahydrofolate cyclohydrolase [Candidatus Peregrinibacteria bacterium GW2011_GWA2_33_10]KKP41203.1 MAG: bifunctional 5,10-methylene-tetrahydrofolate dehydrogenase/5,10-methylene-tetrahydrofolate cyclohydrolase, methylenetetrahydrofolate dehydrogenase (NADP+) / methenyltetrahydrofolate cyclohydrolase [Candidatus Peregrinibacteria bacterium GW2011_GWC2_33_13]
MQNIIDGRSIADKILKEYKKEFEKLAKKGIFAQAEVFIIGDNPASLSYIKQMQKAFEQASAKLLIKSVPLNVKTSEFVNLIKESNKNSKIHGYMIQLPLPNHFDKKKIVDAIDPRKDLDCFSPDNLGRLILGPEFEFLAPSTAKGVIKLLEELNIEVQGKNITVVGHSNIVGKPLTLMLIARNATVTNCHVYTKNLSEYTLKSDIIISATGVPHLIKENMVKKGVIAIDIGYAKKNGKVYGDFEFEKIQKRAKLITPPIGGCGPMTVAALLENLMIAAKNL